jgi:hypothetical protein
MINDANNGLKITYWLLVTPPTAAKKELLNARNDIF